MELLGHVEQSPRVVGTVAPHLVDGPRGHRGLLQRLDGRGLLAVAVLSQALCERVALRGEFVERKRVEAFSLGAWRVRHAYSVPGVPNPKHGFGGGAASRVTVTSGLAWAASWPIERSCLLSWRAP